MPLNHRQSLKECLHILEWNNEVEAHVTTQDGTFDELAQAWAPKTVNKQGLTTSIDYTESSQFVRLLELTALQQMYCRRRLSLAACESARTSASYLVTDSS